MKHSLTEGGIAFPEDCVKVCTAGTMRQNMRIVEIAVHVWWNKTLVSRAEIDEAWHVKCALLEQASRSMLSSSYVNGMPHMPLPQLWSHPPSEA